MEVRGIETRYAGVCFRSRLEAKWAAMFDQLRWPWQYEPIDLKGYIPDFILNLHQPVLVEVKPAVSQWELIQYARKVNDSGWDKEYLIVGAIPYSESILWPQLWGGRAVGIMREARAVYEPAPPAWYHDSLPHYGEPGCLDDAMLVTCTKCRATTFHPAAGYHHCRVCGYPGETHYTALRLASYQLAWANACNLTRWIPKPQEQARREMVR